ncbi:MAG: hypothetical protein AUJ12_00950 [Alphaproteobacteria bacterium CG1_02_46_17]|nr:MAG: hypothetical protein AUJ12_00950 [Alphaproteobacteria bacterium CG1_02_46_17]
MVQQSGGNVSDSIHSNYLSASRDFYRACRENLGIPVVKLAVSVASIGGGIFFAANEGYALAGMMGVLSCVFAGSAVRTARESGEPILEAYERMKSAKEKLQASSFPS